MSEEVSEKKQEISKEHKVEIEDPKEEQIEEHVKQYVAEIVKSEFSGPIPPPNIIKGYEEVLPGAADRIIAMAEKQSSHRQEMEKTMVEAESRDSLLGVLFAFVLGMSCIIASIIMVIFVPDNAGAISGALIGVTGIGTIITAFLKTTRRGYDKTQQGDKK